MPLAIVHEPAEATDTFEAGVVVRVHRGRVRPTNPNLNAYLLALLKFPDYAPPEIPGCQRSVHMEQDDAGWCSYQIRDGRIT